MPPICQALGGSIGKLDCFLLAFLFVAFCSSILVDLIGMAKAVFPEPHLKFFPQEKEKTVGQTVFF